MEQRTLLIALAALCSLATGEVIKAQKCYVPSGQKANCEIHQVRLDPCPEAADGKPCKVKLGANATIAFDYTTKWGATKLGSQAFKVGEVVDVGFEQMDTNGCLYTTCPVEANKAQTYTFALTVSSQFPATTHIAKWKLWNEDDYHQQCCFKFPLALIN